jgi:hypothetical protein
MIIVAKKPILQKIDEAVNEFLLKTGGDVEYVVLSDNEWEDAAKALNLSQQDTEFRRKGVLCVLEGFMASTEPVCVESYTAEKQSE